MIVEELKRLKEEILSQASSLEEEVNWRTECVGFWGSAPAYEEFPATDADEAKLEAVELLEKAAGRLEEAIAYCEEAMKIKEEVER